MPATPALPVLSCPVLSDGQADVPRCPLPPGMQPSLHTVICRDCTPSPPSLSLHTTTALSSPRPP
jgi:hypothetical protein